MSDLLAQAVPPGVRMHGDAAVLAVVNDIVRQVLEDHSIVLQADTPTDALAGWDPMTHVAIMVEAECRFDVLFELDDLELVRTVGDVVRMIQSKRSTVRPVVG